ncbi:MAG: hypothetical protein KF819_03970 [Labilithrix sp.]|nr:hypothetical protein [Labilithrix sp.]
MRTLHTLLFGTMLAVSAAACKHPGSAKLEGHWKGTRADGVPPGVQDAANSFALGTEIIVKGNQITVTTPAAKGQTSTYVVDDENKTTVVLHTEKDGPNAKETFALGEDGKTMTWRLGEGRTIVFQKVQD